MKLRYKILMPFTWLAYSLVGLPLSLLGFVLVPVALALSSTKEDWPKLLWLWGNDIDDPRDPVASPRLAVADYMVNKPKWFRAYYWYALRNPVNNSRFLFKEPTSELEVETNYYTPHAHMNAYDVWLAYGDNYSAWRWARKGWLGYFEYVRVIDGLYTREFYAGFKVGKSKRGELDFTLQAKGWLKKRRIKRWH